MSDGHGERIDNDVDLGVLISIFRKTRLVVRTDERMRAMLMSGELRMPYYNVRGQEVLSAAAMTALRRDDYLVTTYRGMHDELSKGTPIALLLSEYFGRVTGTCRGKGGPMHITDVENGVMVTTGIVGSGMPIAVGLGLASAMKGEDRVTLVSFGDGASNIGAFHEALNLAQLWKLPVIFLCQNNRWGEHTPFNGATDAASVIDRAIGYGIKGVQVDGNDAIAMYSAVASAVNRARTGKGPTLIEAMTYRMMGHTLGSPSNYMPKAYLAEAKAADPLPRLRALLLDRGVDGARLDEIDAEVLVEVNDGIAFAFASPYPDGSEIRTHVLAEEIAA